MPKGKGYDSPPGMAKRTKKTGKPPPPGMAKRAAAHKRAEARKKKS